MTGTDAPAIYFHPDMIEGEGRSLVGRRSAGSSFLAGFLAHGAGAEIRVLTDGPTETTALRELLEARGEGRPADVVELRGTKDFTRFGAIFFPSPGYGEASWRRLRYGANRCSLIGVTHTVATRRVVDGFHRLMTEPVEEWDAIICTSTAVHSVVERQFRMEEDYLRQRFGATRVPQPQLPVIPLGIDTAAFAPRPGARERFRAAQGVPDEAVVVMTLGRFSTVEKSNPVPLFLALEQAARTSGRDIRLWLTGWASRAEEEVLFRDGAAALCPSVPTALLDGRDGDVRRDAWAAADIFTLPSDSIQETFGLAPLEAMAAGLPVVMPDWNGFRDTVRHGQTGIRVPTRMAGAGTGGDLARRYADGRDPYLAHLTLVQAQVQIDVPAYAEALAALASDASLRARLGAAGAAHAKADYDWAAVIPRYLDLASDLAERRQGRIPATRMLRPGLVSPLEADPFHLYAGYPSATLGPDDEVRPGAPADGERFDLIDRLSGRELYRRRMLRPDLALKILAAVEQAGTTTPAALAERLDRSPETIVAAVLQLAKADLVRLSRAPVREPPRKP